MPIVRVPISEWTPDLGKYEHDGLWKVFGAIGYAGRWSPVPGILGEDLGSGGAGRVLSQTYGLHVHTLAADPSQVYIFVGINNGIYRTNSGTSLANASISGVLNTPDTISGWQFTSWGDSVFACGSPPNVVGTTIALQYKASASAAGNFVAVTTVDPASAWEPFPRYITTVKQHLVLANIYHNATQAPFTAGTTDESLVMWSATGLPLNFGDKNLSVNFVGSGYQSLKDEFGPITGISGGDNAYIFKPKAIYSMTGPPFTFYPVITGTGTIYPNSIVRYYDDVYFWGPGGITRLSGDGSSLEVLGFGKVSSTITEEQNSDHGAYAFELSGLNGLATYSGAVKNIDISGVADYKTGVLAWFVSDAATVSAGAAYYRDTVCITYDTRTQQFGRFLVNKKFKYARSVARFMAPPLSNTAGTKLTPATILDGTFGVFVPADGTPTTEVDIAQTYGDVQSATAGTPPSAWSMKFTTPYRYFNLNGDGPATCAIQRARIPFSIGQRLTTSNIGQVTITISVQTRDGMNDDPTVFQQSKTLNVTAPLPTIQDDWIELNTNTATYHQIDVLLTAKDSAGNILDRWISHIKDISMIELDITPGGVAGGSKV